MAWITLGIRFRSMNFEFTHSAYRILLESFLEQGYRVCAFDEADPEARHLIVRHDIDMSLALAEPIAAIEADMGLSAVYFVLVSSVFYNPFSPASRRSLEKIRALGHEVGLHFDAAHYDDRDESLDAAVEAECNILEMAVGTTVRTISFHRPVSKLQSLARPLAGRRHAYEPRFFSEMGYCSDSRGAWHHGHPLEHEAFLEGRAIQLLTHPIWWSEENVTEPLPKLDQFLHERRQLMESELAENCAPYRAVFPRGEGGRSD